MSYHYKFVLEASKSKESIIYHDYDTMILSWRFWHGGGEAIKDDEEVFKKAMDALHNIGRHECSFQIMMSGIHITITYYKF